MIKRYTFISKNWLRFGLVAAFAVSFLSSSAQNAPAKMWDKTFGGNAMDDLYSLTQTTDGGYLLGGRSQSGISGDKSGPTIGVGGFEDFWIVKLDINGNKIWDKTIGGNSGDFFTTQVQTTDGGFLLGGSSASGISGDKTESYRGNNSNLDFWIVKLNASGIKQWDKTFGGALDEGLTSLAQTSDGGYILGGYSGSGVSFDKSEPNRGGIDFWVVKLNANGQKVWDKTIGGSDGDNLISLQQTADGGYILGGLSLSGISGEKSESNKGITDYWIVKLDANGNKQWDKTIGGNYQDQLSSIVQTPDGGYILGGTSASGISSDKSMASYGGSEDFWIVKLNANGVKQWDKTIGGSYGDIFVSLQQIQGGGYLLAGTSGSDISFDKTQDSKGSSDFWVVKLDGNGNKLWDKTIGGNYTDNFRAHDLTSDGGFIIGGTSYSAISGDKSEAPKGYYDYWVVKLAADVTGTTESFSNSQLSISPNPSHGKFNLQLENISTSKVEVSVSDLLGRVILQKELPVLNNQVSEELELKAAKGMYLLQIKAGNQASSRKIVVE